jgi:hypothetical protein
VVYRWEDVTLTHLDDSVRFSDLGRASRLCTLVPFYPPRVAAVITTLQNGDKVDLDGKHTSAHETHSANSRKLHHVTPRRNSGPIDVIRHAEGWVGEPQLLSLIGYTYHQFDTFCFSCCCSSNHLEPLSWVMVQKLKF